MIFFFVCVKLFFVKQKELGTEEIVFFHFFIFFYRYNNVSCL